MAPEILQLDLYEDDLSWSHQESLSPGKDAVTKKKMLLDLKAPGTESWLSIP